MRKTTVIAIIFGLAFLMGASQVSAGNGSIFGGVFNFFQWQRDDDGDGIPNCEDEDYVRPQDGTGYKSHYGFGDGDSGTFGEGDGTQVQNEYNNRHNYRYNETEGDMLRDRDFSRDKTRSRLQDGSCQE